MSVLPLSLALALALALFTVELTALELTVIDKEILCTNNRHVSGAWVKKNLASATKSFFCCDATNDFNPPKQEQLCGNSSILESITFRGSTRYLTQVTASGCACDQAAGNRSQINKVDAYKWMPSYCMLLEWNATQFCDLLGNRTLLLVGDSTMQQAAGTLMSMLTTGAGKCVEQIVFGRSNDLWKWPRYSNNLYDWVEMIKPDIVIFSAGAHIHAHHSYLEVWRHVSEAIHRMRSWTNATLVWRTQHGGHVDCNLQQKPSTHFTLNDASRDRFHWNLYPLFDQYAVQFATQLNISILDMSPVYLRADAHPPGDCLHFCTPGPLDLFSQLLLNMMYTREI
jgi:hypothetical protein